ncbi:hypothetical protein B0H14DRAFT_2571810 [Mycena olivaceomarginata]|nr:hypothetical protein B0H14DRAFT_2571810 [Mycena olivaceomarginata]
MTNRRELRLGQPQNPEYRVPLRISQFLHILPQYPAHLGSVPSTIFPVPCSTRGFGYGKRHLAMNNYWWLLAATECTNDGYQLPSFPASATGRYQALMGAQEPIISGDLSTWAQVPDSRWRMRADLGTNARPQTFPGDGGIPGALDFCGRIRAGKWGRTRDLVENRRVHGILIDDAVVILEAVAASFRDEGEPHTGLVFTDNMYSEMIQLNVRTFTTSEIITEIEESSIGPHENSEDGSRTPEVAVAHHCGEYNQPEWMETLRLTVWKQSA